MAIDDVSSSWALNCRRPACCRELGPVDKYEHVTFFLHEFRIQNLHRAIVLLSKQSILLLQDRVWVYGTADAVNKSYFVKEMADVWDKAVQLMDGSLQLSVFTQRDIELLEQGHWS